MYRGFYQKAIVFGLKLAQKKLSVQNWSEGLNSSQEIYDQNSLKLAIVIQAEWTTAVVNWKD